MSVLKKIVHYTYRPALIRYLKKDRTYRYAGLNMHVKQGIFHPGFFFSTKLLINALASFPLKNKTVLELGSGSGLISLWCAREGAEVTASDIQSVAVQNTQENALKNGLNIQVFQSNLFDQLPNKQIDYLIVNPPYYPKNVETEHQHAWFCGEHFEYFHRFFEQWKTRKSNESICLMSLSEDCDIQEIKSISRKYGFQLKEYIKKRTGWEWHYVFNIVDSKQLEESKSGVLNSDSISITRATGNLNSTQSHIIRTLLYFDIFNYPITASEIHQFLGVKRTLQEIELELKTMVSSGLIHQKNTKYFSVSAFEDQVEKREKGNASAKRMMKTAYRFSKFISRFPFVRGLSLSGSLSKGYIDAQGDIDYFVITHPGRLWIARSVLIAFKKLFLLNSKKYFCVNYFIDTEHLEIPDKNIFTATELQTLIPTYNLELHQSILRANDWSKEMLPNHENLTHSLAHPQKDYVIKTLIEKALNGSLGEKLDTWFMKQTMKRWERKFDHFNHDYFSHALRSRKYVSKHHPQNFQYRVLTSLESGISDFEAKHQVKLNLEA